MSYSMPGRHRPLGVAILAALIGLVGIVYVIVGFLAVLFLGPLDLVFPSIFGSGFVAGLILLILGIVFVIVAKGLWDLRQWALVLCLVLVGILWLQDVATGRLLTLSGVVYLLLIVYLVAVHRAFR